MKYESAPSYTSTNGVPPAPGPTKGALALSAVSMSSFPEITSGGIYNPRRTRLASGWGKNWSHHALGTAWDAMVAVDRNSWPDGNPAGLALAEKLTGHYQALGVMQVVFAGKFWRCTSPSKWQNLSSKSLQHYDHLHIELTGEAGRTLTEVEAARIFDVPVPVTRVYLRLGDSGPQVRDLALMLRAGDVDVFDEVVHNAVIKFQQTKKLSVDGIAGPATLQALLDDISSSIIWAYAEFADRAPDPSGLTYWTTVIQGNYDSMSELVDGLIIESAPVVTVPPVPVPPVPVPPVTVPPTPPVPPAAPLTDQEALAAIGQILSQTKVL